MASGGYPGAYRTGAEIHGLAEAGGMEGCVVFHAGTRREDGRCLAAGGRVLDVTALGADLPEALARAYRAVERIHWDGAHYRRDIGAKGWPRRGRRHSERGSECRRVGESRGEMGMAQQSAYGAAGVDLSAKGRVVDLMRQAVRSTCRPEVLLGIGAFGGLFDAGRLRDMRSPCWSARPTAWAPRRSWLAPWIVTRHRGRISSTTR